MHKVVNYSTRGFPVIINAVGFPLKTRKGLNGDAKEETTSKNINLGIKETRSREEATIKFDFTYMFESYLDFLPAGGFSSTLNKKYNRIPCTGIHILSLINSNDLAVHFN
ncbi:hypothetical protein P5673_009671 [Acropora cervicornis]|uniref:Uncharacterized protein n=1 Tax=Acropora cervicornis TaxID=6130 RepID=A0AAD9QRU1_ACRCE|nr:hypothetical protein P5673_009671 [Acropora cervicornis]